MSSKIIFPGKEPVNEILEEKVNSFVSDFNIFEIKENSSLVLYFDFTTVHF